MWIIELEQGVWFAPWTNGDPPRTCDKKFARRYATEKGAKAGLGYCRRFRKFAKAKIVPVKPTVGERIAAGLQEFVDGGCVGVAEYVVEAGRKS